MTALVLDVLAQFKTIYSLQTQIDKAAAHLFTKQNTDGGFGSSPSNVYETALSLISLIQSGQGQAQPLQTFQIANISGDGSTTLTYTFTASPQTYRFYAVADTENVVAEMYEPNNTAIRSLKIKSPGEILGPDLVPIKIDLTGTTTDPQTLAISGTAHVTLQNNGDDKITTPFNVLIFEDTDNDHLYTPQIDRKLETGRYAVGRIGSEQEPAIAIVVHDGDRSSYPGERVYLLEPGGTIIWGPEYIDKIGPAGHTAENKSRPVITDFDGDGEMEIVICMADKEIALDRDGNLKK